MYSLQKILTHNFIMVDGTRDLYYRSPDSISTGLNGEGVIKKSSVFDFFTYFNALSIEKWIKYTYAQKFYLVIEAKGKFTVDLFGHYSETGGNIKKEWLGQYSFDSYERKQIILPYPVWMQSTVVAFSLNVESNSCIYDTYYSADLENPCTKKPYIALTTTTFKKENYVKRNISLLQEQIFSDSEYANAFCWNIIDNGKTLPESKDPNSKIRIFHNKNVGGAGGFARGMIEAMQQPQSPTHVLLMDDDVVFSAESFKRLYKLLSIMRPEYENHFISGAMLKMGAPNIQHEDTGKLNKLGFHEATKHEMDLNLWHNVLLNEKIVPDVSHQYAAWWFCCIPGIFIRPDNLPLPVFVRGDDVEYSLRNNADFITMNGLCIWHEGFEGKFGAALEYYQVERNELIVRAMHPDLSDVDVLGHIKEIFWQELYKFNYKGASLLLDAVEDYMKGPEYFFSLNLFEKMQEKRKQDNQLRQITDDIRKTIDYGELYAYHDLEKKKKFLYDYTYNGQSRIPQFLTSNKAGVIPYGWGYFPEKLCMRQTIYAIDPVNDKYTIYKKDRKKFQEIKSRFEQLISNYECNNSIIEEKYQKYLKEVTGFAFWKKYLDIDKII